MIAKLILPVAGCVTGLMVFAVAGRQYTATDDAWCARATAQVAQALQPYGLRAQPRAAVRGAFETAITLAPGACVSALLLAEGRETIEQFEISDDRGRLLSDPGSRMGGDMAALRGWCSVEGEVVHARGRLRGAGRLLRFEGVVPRSAWPLAEVMPEAGLHPWLDDRLVLSAPGAVNAVVLDVGEAVALVPPEAATVDALGALTLDDPRAVRWASVGLSDPSVAAEPLANPASPRQARAAAVGAPGAVVAVFDPGALAQRCLNVSLRAAWGRGETVVRLALSTWQMAARGNVDGAVRDTVCVDEGPVAYVVVGAGPRRVGLSWQGEGAQTRAPSTWRSDPAQHPGWAPLEAQCRAGRGGCEGLAVLRAAGARGGPRALGEVYAAACAAGRGEGCHLAAIEGADGPAAGALVARGCALGYAPACAASARWSRLGERNQPVDYALAGQRYEAACRLGDTGACARRDTMRLLDL